MTAKPRSPRARTHKAVAEEAAPEPVAVAESAPDPEPVAVAEAPADPAPPEEVEPAPVALLADRPEPATNPGGPRCANCGTLDLEGGVIVDEPQVSYAAFCAAHRPANR